MARIDSILSIVRQQGANELRVGTDREPKMLADGVPKRLSIPATPEDILRELLGDILSAERAETLRTRGRVTATYDAGGLGTFHVTIVSREGGGFDAVFVHGAPRPPKAPPAPEPAKPPTPPSVIDAEPVVATPPPSSPATLATSTGEASRLSALVLRAAGMRASDLHLGEAECPTVRVDGVLRRLDDEPPVDVLATMPLDEGSRERLEKAESVDLGLEVPGVGRVRVHVYSTATGPAAALRLVPPVAPTFSSLHMPLPFDDLVELPHGLVLVCGATGSGKSTTLAALAQEALRRRSIVLVTLEDPIEYALTASSRSLVRRRQVGRDVPDFAAGLRDALREDPDVLLVGEMRDPETIGLALTAAETGHLVLASMHSRSSASAIERIVDIYPPERQQQIRVQLADSLRAVIAQRLLPRARGGGRIPAIEVLRVTHAVASLIREGKTAQVATALQSGRKEGMLSLERCLADRVQAGEIRAEDARAVANEPASLAMYLAR